MSLAANRARIGGLTQELLRQWQTTRETWLDAKSDEFERRYIDELRSAVNASSSALEQLERVLNKLRNDCGQ